MHVFLDRNIWQASIMLITNQPHLKEEESLEGWDCLDDWAILEVRGNEINGQSLVSNATSQSITVAMPMICPSLSNIDAEHSEAQNTSKLGERQVDMIPCEDVIFASIIDGSESGYLEEDKDSRKTSVITGSPSDSNDFLV